MRRRRRAVTVWPAFTDLMTVLAVVGLFVGVGISHQAEEGQVDRQRLAELEQEVQELETRIHELEAAKVGVENDLAEARRQAALEEREAARNREMFRAIQAAQKIVDQISESRELRFSRDQTLQFGDDLVEFALNSIEPIWKPAGREKLRRFCELLARTLGQSGEDGRPLREVFTVQVEGHTDSSRCPDDPNCNWTISSGRAASFVAMMRRDDLCPGGRELELRPIGFADTEPYAEPGEVPKPTRRIAVRVVPDYSKLVLFF